MKKSQPSSRTVRYGLLLFVFAVMLVLNHFTPYLADDFTFSYSFADRDVLSSPFILLRSLYYHYMEWSGRVVVKFFAQLFTIPPKWVFDVCNAAMFALLGWVLCRLGNVQQKQSALSLGFAFLSLWLVSPVFGQTNLWMCGSCNNLWSTAGCMAFLLPWRTLFAKTPAHYNAPLLFIGGVFAGWLYENTSAGMLAAMALCLVWQLLRKRPLPRWALAAFAGSCIGYLLLILAPGNSVRTDDSAGVITASVWVYVLRIQKAVLILFRHGWPLLLAFVVLAVMVQRSQKSWQALVWPGILFVSGLAAHFAMALSPVYYLRSTHGPFAFFTAACCACLVQLPRGSARRALCAVCMAAGAWALVVLVFAGYDIVRYSQLYAERDAAIRAEAAQGCTEIETWAIAPNTVYCSAWGLPDIREGEDWISITRAMWYGLDGLGLKTGVQGVIWANSSAPVHYAPLLGLYIGTGKTD